jgi:hypothetical protein
MNHPTLCFFKKSKSAVLFEIVFWQIYWNASIFNRTIGPRVFESARLFDIQIVFLLLRGGGVTVVVT